MTVQVECLELVSVSEFFLFSDWIPDELEFVTLHFSPSFVYRLIQTTDIDTFLRLVSKNLAFTVIHCWCDISVGNSVWL